mmetsp:Transcript_132386/g.264076  ORF Transcript_132386/g.264076 Transcript_132386/m.264076 type:complete len:270 (+) Transcript_132386:97-906(+)
MKQGGKKDEGALDPSGERKRVRFKVRTFDGGDDLNAQCEENGPEPQPEILEDPPRTSGTIWHKSFHVGRQPQATFRTVRSFLSTAFEASVEERGLVLHVTLSGAHENARLEIEVQADPDSHGASLLFKGHSESSSSDDWRLSCLYNMVVDHLDAADHRSIRKTGANRGSCSELFDNSFASEHRDTLFNPLLSEALGNATCPRRSLLHNDDIFEDASVGIYSLSPPWSLDNTSVGMSSRSSPWSSEKSEEARLAWISATDSMWRVDVAEP